MVPLEVDGFGAADATHVVRQPNHGWGCKELGGVQNTCHLLSVVCERKGREMWWSVGVRASGSFSGSEVIQGLGIWCRDGRLLAPNFREQNMRIPTERHRSPIF